MMFDLGDTGEVVSLQTLTIADSVKLGGQITRVGRKIARQGGHALAIVLVIDEDGTPHLDLLGRNPMRLDIYDLAKYTRAAITALQQASREGITNDEAMKTEWTRLLALDERLKTEERMKLAATPWACEHCGRRYKTQRGTERHELTCVSQPRGSEHSWISCVGVGDDCRVYTCRCGWHNEPAPQQQAAAAIRRHFNSHRPATTEPTSLFDASSSAS